MDIVPKVLVSELLAIVCPEARAYMLQLVALLQHTSNIERTSLPDEGTTHATLALEHLRCVTRVVLVAIAGRHRQPQSRHIREQSVESEKRVALIMKRWGHTPATAKDRTSGEVAQVDSHAIQDAFEECNRVANHCVFKGPVMEIVDHPEVGWKQEAVAPVLSYMQHPPPSHRSKQVSQWISRKRHRVEVGIFCPAKASDFYSMGMREQRTGSYIGVSCEELLAMSIQAHDGALALGASLETAAAASSSARSQFVLSCGPCVKPASRDLFAANVSELTRAGDYIQAVALTNERILVESGSESMKACLEAMGGKRTESGGCRITRTKYPPLVIDYARAMPRSTVFLAFGGKSHMACQNRHRHHESHPGMSLIHKPHKTVLMKRPTKRGVLCYIPMGRRAMATPLHTDTHDAMFRVETTRIPQWLKLRTWHTSIHTHTCPSTCDVRV